MKLHSAGLYRRGRETECSMFPGDVCPACVYVVKLERSNLACSGI